MMKKDSEKKKKDSKKKNEANYHQLIHGLKTEALEEAGKKKS